ncbi:MAG: hypothetical protein PHV95_10945 [Eubacteriales bacterium]|nr:hypothetical protein [Eubacteriales bacterium]
MDNSYNYFSLIWDVKLPKRLPKDGIRIYTPIFINLKEDYNDMWTAEIIILKYYQSTYYGKIRYLFDGAPTHLLTDGALFSIFDGVKSTGTGTIINEEV